MRRVATTTGWIFGFTLAVLLLPDRLAYAYLDPTSGSFILQAVVAAILGGLVTLRLFWGQITRALRGSKASDEGQPDPGDDPKA